LIYEDRVVEHGDERSFHILAISAEEQELRTQGVAAVVMAVWCAHEQATSVAAQPTD